MHPPPQIEEMLDARLAELGPPKAPDAIAKARCGRARDESVARGDGHVARGLGKRRSHCQYQHRPGIEGAAQGREQRCSCLHGNPAVTGRRWRPSG
jgi:hypothetical protein